MICLAISTVLKNTYQILVKLFVTGGKEIESSEGISQGVPLATEMYALSITPLSNGSRKNDSISRQRMSSGVAI